jgi:hypothetical protein
VDIWQLSRTLFFNERIRAKHFWLSLSWPSSSRMTFELFSIFLNASPRTYPARMNRIRDETTRPNIFFVFFREFHSELFFGFANVP